MRQLSRIRPPHLTLFLAVRCSSSAADPQAAMTVRQALDCLEAPCGCSNKELKKCFQARTLVVHPDQGGSSAAMMRLTDGRDIEIPQAPPAGQAPANQTNGSSEAPQGKQGDRSEERPQNREGGGGGERRERGDRR